MAETFVAVAACATIPDGQFIKLTHNGQRLILAHVAGRYHAVEDQCSHDDYPLSFGCLDGACIKCSLHGSRFSLETGDPLDAPADQPIRVFPVQVRDGQIWIGLG